MAHSTNRKHGLQAGLRKRWLAKPYRRLDGLTVNIRWWEVSLPTVARLLNAQLREQWTKESRRLRIGLRPTRFPVTDHQPQWHKHGGGRQTVCDRCRRGDVRLHQPAA